jgi:hypothetical protein
MMERKELVGDQRNGAAVRSTLQRLVLRSLSPHRDLNQLGRLGVRQFLKAYVGVPLQPPGSPWRSHVAVANGHDRFSRRKGGAVSASLEQLSGRHRLSRTHFMLQYTRPHVRGDQSTTS